MRSLHADFKFRQRPAESTVVSAKYLRNFSVEKSYAPWNLRRDGEQSAARRNDYAIRDTLDCNPKFQGSVVSVNQMVMLMVGCVVVFGIIFLCMTALPEKDGK